MDSTSSRFFPLKKKLESSAKKMDIVDLHMFAESFIWIKTNNIQVQYNYNIHVHISHLRVYCAKET